MNLRKLSEVIASNCKLNKHVWIIIIMFAVLAIADIFHSQQCFPVKILIP